MFDTILKNTTGIEFGTVMLLLGLALVLGLAISAVYKLTERGASRHYLIALVILPVIVCTVVSLVNGHLGVAIAVAGSFTLVRFRSQQGNAKEMAVIFFDMALGLAAASGYVFFTVVFAVLIMAVLVILSLTGFGKYSEREKHLKIAMPETVDYDEAFKEVFAKYTDRVELESVKTTNKDTILEVKYNLVLKKEADVKAFLKDLSSENCHMPITLSKYSKKSDL